MYYVYALQSEKTGHIYIGMTQDIKKRIHQHNSGNSGWTKKYRPWKLIHLETQPDSKTARQKEKYYKTGIGREEVKKSSFADEAGLPAVTPRSGA